MKHHGATVRELLDYLVWSTPEEKMQTARSLVHRDYHPQPLRRAYVPKSGSKKQRGLGIPTFKDRAMQALYSLALLPVAETQADPNAGALDDRCRIFAESTFAHLYSLSLVQPSAWRAKSRVNIFRPPVAPRRRPRRWL